MSKRIFLLFFLLFHLTVFPQERLSLISWNIRDFGKTKNTEELNRIADIVRNADIVAIQEVVAGYGGAQAVAKLADQLNRKGSKWDYVISNPTKSSKYVTERYAFIWKTRHIKIKNRGALIKDLEKLVDREPFYLDFYKDGKKFTIINFHSRPHDKNPEAEIAAITNYLMETDHQTPLILAGDFNVDEKNPIFNALKALGFKASITSQKTTLKHTCQRNDYLNYAIDNIFYSPDILKLQGKAIDFVGFCENLSSARRLSDHLPVFLAFEL